MGDRVPRHHPAVTALRVETVVPMGVYVDGVDVQGSDSATSATWSQCFVDNLNVVVAAVGGVRFTPLCSIT